jgi:type I restriction enzyme S subunit
LATFGDVVLADVCELIVDCEHKTAPVQAEGYPSIRTPNIGRGRLILDGVNRVSTETYHEWTRRAVPRPGDLILAREAPAGNVAMIPPGLDVCLGQRTVLLRPDRARVDPAFLLYRLLADDVQSVIQSLSTGATVGHFNVADVRRLAIPNLPTLEVQRRIGTTLADYDRLIENNRRRIEIGAEIAHSMYREWFVDMRFPGHATGKDAAQSADSVPRGWVACSLGDVMTLEYGRALPSPLRRPGPSPVFGSSGVVGYHSTPLVTGPAVIVGRKGNVGAVYWSLPDFYPIDTVFWAKSDLPSEFIYYLLRSQQFQSSDTAVPGLSRAYAHSIPVVLPTSDLIERFIELVAPSMRLADSLKRQTALAIKLRDWLLPHLLSGEVEPDRLPYISELGLQ